MNLAEDAANEAAKSIARQGGPFAVQATIMMLALLAGVGFVGWVMLPAAKNFVDKATETNEQNAHNIEKLSEAAESNAATIKANSESIGILSESMAQVHNVHASMLAALQTTQRAVESNGNSIHLSVQQTQEMLSMMQDAYQMMKDAPTVRAEQTDLLKRINAGIQELNARVSENQQ